MSTPISTKASPEEYLELEKQAAHKSEYRNGEMVAMVGASPAHNIIVANLIAALYNCLRKSSCIVLASDMEVFVPECENYYYPDAIVVGGKMQFDENRKDCLVNPSIIIEVLSPGTESVDRGEKFKCYRTIPSLEEYVMVSSGQVLVERYRREEINHWDLLFTAQPEDSILLSNCGVSLNDIYENVDFTTA